MFTHLVIKDGVKESRLYINSQLCIRSIGRDSYFLKVTGRVYDTHILKCLWTPMILGLLPLLFCQLCITHECTV